MLDPICGQRSDELPDCPCNLTAEKSVLGAIILDNAALSSVMSVIRAR
jgi:replicative DNA helicase